MTFFANVIALHACVRVTYVNEGKKCETDKKILNSLTSH